MDESATPFAQDLLNRLYRKHLLENVSDQIQGELIGPGSYLVRNSGMRILVALPGTTVGVALYDRTAGVGGIIHLLLPEPVGRSASRNPENYASSGLEFFIQKLTAAGAVKERLEACVGGGTFLGRTGSANMPVHLGEQIANVTLATLTQQKIRIASAKTGGAFPFSLLLDTRSWRASVELLTEEQEEPASPESVRKPSSHEIEKAISETRPIPKVALKVIELVRRRNYDMAELTAEIKQDQIIAAKVLRFSNSPLIGTGMEITSVDRALMLLGEKNLLEVVVSSAVDFLFSQYADGYVQTAGGLYRHALGVAYTAKEISLFTGWVEPGTAYTAGLLHDIGKVVLNSFIGKTLPLFYQTTPGQFNDFAEFEKKLLGIDHLTAGTLLAKQWNLPQPLTEVIAHHHWPEETTDSNRKLVHMIYLADLITTAYLAGLEVERINVHRLQDRLDELGLNFTHLPLIIDNVPWPKLLTL